jgi:hypothetical protein
MTALSEPTFHITRYKGERASAEGKEELLSHAQWRSYMLDHREQPQKSGEAFIPGRVVGKRRAKSVKQIDALLLDLDGTSTQEQAQRAIEKSGLAGFLHSTHSHLATRTLVSTQTWKAQAKKSGLPARPETAADFAAYFAAQGKDLYRAIRFDGEREHTGEGICYVVHHEPVPRFRVVLLLAKPITIIDLAHETKDALAEYARIYRAVGQMLGLKFDESCTDPSRLWYRPSHPPGAEHVALEFDGVPLAWDAPAISGQKPATSEQPKPVAGHGPRDVTDRDGVPYDVNRWAAAHNDFAMADLLEGIDGLFIDERSAGGITMHCPFEAEHSDEGGAGTWVDNANADHGWEIDCRHNACAGRTRLDFLKKLIADGCVSWDDLDLWDFKSIVDDPRIIEDAKTIPGVAKWRAHTLQKLGLDEQGNRIATPAPVITVKPTKAEEKRAARMVREWHSLADLKAKKFDPLKWIVHSILPEGCVILAGRPKKGKSWLALDIGLAVAEGGVCLFGLNVEAGDVLYLALEDTERRLKDRAAKLLAGRPWPAGFSYQSLSDSFPTGEAAIAEIEAWLDTHPKARLVIVDVLKCVRDRGPSKGRSPYDLDYEAMQLFRDLAGRRRVSVLVVHHTRKGKGEDPIDEISGTLGLAGAADGVLVLSSNGDGGGTSLLGRGRDMEEIALDVEFVKDAARWRILGEKSFEEKPRATQRRSVEEFIREFLGARGVWKPSKEMTTLARAEGFSFSTIKRARTALGVIARDKRKRGAKKPDWWICLPTTIEDDFDPIQASPPAELFKAGATVQ